MPSQQRHNPNYCLLRNIAAQQKPEGDTSWRYRFIRFLGKGTVNCSKLNTFCRTINAPTTPRVKISSDLLKSRTHHDQLSATFTRYKRRTNSDLFFITFLYICSLSIRQVKIVNTEIQRKRPAFKVSGAKVEGITVSVVALHFLCRGVQMVFT